jgi:hypothetical protein
MGEGHGRVDIGRNLIHGLSVSRGENAEWRPLRDLLSERIRTCDVEHDVDIRVLRLELLTQSLKRGRQRSSSGDIQGHLARGGSRTARTLRAASARGEKEAHCN